jgi:predicted membrane channel-forming protein YqfA (hemolysin III family)
MTLKVLQVLKEIDYILLSIGKTILQLPSMKMTTEYNFFVTAVMSYFLCFLLSQFIFMISSTAYHSLRLRDGIGANKRESSHYPHR